MILLKKLQLAPIGACLLVLLTLAATVPAKSLPVYRTHLPNGWVVTFPKSWHHSIMISLPIYRIPTWVPCFEPMAAWKRGDVLVVKESDQDGDTRTLTYWDMRTNHALVSREFYSSTCKLCYEGFCHYNNFGGGVWCAWNWSKKKGPAMWSDVHKFTDHIHLHLQDGYNVYD